jgi:hypothetical protein
MLALIILSLFLSCSGFGDAQRSGASPSTAGNDVSQASTPSTKRKPYVDWIYDTAERTFEFDSTAAELLASVEKNPRDAGKRRALAEHYASIEYLTLSRFFASTAEYATSGSTQGYDPEDAFHARCVSPLDLPPVPPEEFRSEDVTQMLERLRQALVDVRAEQSKGQRRDCAFFLRWAQTIGDATVDDLPTTPLEQERAIRILVTLADDARLYPTFTSSTAEVYRSVGALFDSKHDYRSAFCAFSVARDRALESGKSSGSFIAALERMQLAAEQELARERQR